jgi:hypothetical protein
LFRKAEADLALDHAREWQSAVNALRQIVKPSA